MNQEYQVLVALDLLTTQMNKYANKKLKPYGLKFNELNIIRFVAQTNKSGLSKNDLSKFSIASFDSCGNCFSFRR